MVVEVARAPRPVTCKYESERNGKVVMLVTEVVAARSVMKRGSKSPAKVSVYTPFVTVSALPAVAALPVMSAVTVWEKVFAPVKVLSVYVLGIVVDAWMRAMMPEAKSETWELVMERAESVVMDEEAIW